MSQAPSMFHNHMKYAHPSIHLLLGIDTLRKKDASRLSVREALPEQVVANEMGPTRLFRAQTPRISLAILIHLVSY